MGFLDFFKPNTQQFSTQPRIENLTYVPIPLSYDQKVKRHARKIQVKTSNLTKTTSLKKLKNGFIAIDTETTGVDAKNDFIIEVAAIKFINFKPTEIFTTLIKPDKLIPSEASKVNGITNAMVANAPKFEQIFPALNDFLGDYPLVAHNAPFDCNFLYMSGVSKISDKTVYDTLELSKKTTRDLRGNKLANYKLATLCQHYHICLNGAHRASADTLACGLLFVELVCERCHCTKNELFQSA